ncbi:hypothetical protein KC19_7G013000 [Ceratodon purpureus]|uniref:F-box domain-containing protein n=1 Tax=Ceratodon purpureus TaxID=3225 RepID=A0A8T0H4Y2_CERPU|nr:hypothetical protein KC19_7G013000 [Ceratodon purpureus]
MMARNWDFLMDFALDTILSKLEFKDLFRCKIVSKLWKNRIESDDFCQFRGASFSQEGSFTAISYYVKKDVWRCFAYDLHSNSWRLLPPFPYIPVPDAHQNFRMYTITGHRSLMCAQVFELPNVSELVVFNPLTGKRRVLPPLLYPRNPALVHISVNSATKSYIVIAAGSSSLSKTDLSKKVEVFHSSSSKWTEASDLPDYVFGLKAHQAGVCVNGVLNVIALLKDSDRRGVIAFDVENEKWLEDMACAIPFARWSLTLIECNRKVHLFSRKMDDGLYLYCIDVLECPNLNTRAEAWHWRNVVQFRENNQREWQIFMEHGRTLYEEYSCVSFGDGKLCVFNMLNCDGVVYDMQDGRQVSVLAAPPEDQKGEVFQLESSIVQSATLL